MLEPHRDRITWDAAIYSPADVDTLPFPPKCLNSKPSRFGSARGLFDFYDLCEQRGIALYGGGQFELGLGRGQIQHLASLFHPDGPNDVAPGAYNFAPRPRACRAARFRRRRASPASAESTAVVGSAHAEIRGLSSGLLRWLSAPPAPRPSPCTRAHEAVTSLRSAIEDEKRALELLKKDPPHLRAARDRIYGAADRVNGVYDFLSGVPDAAAGQDALGGARADDYAAGHLLPHALRTAPEGAPTGDRVPRACAAAEACGAAVRCRTPRLPRLLPSAPTARTTTVTESPTGRPSRAARPPATCARAPRFSCGVGSKIVTGRLVLSGSCTGAFSEIEVMLLDDVQLNGRWDIMHAPSCGRDRHTNRDSAARRRKATRTRSTMLDLPPRHDVALPGTSASSSASSTSASARSGASSCRPSWCRRRPEVCGGRSRGPRTSL